MPGAPELIDVMAFSNDDNLLMMRSTASLYSSQGLLSGMLTLYRNRLLWSEVSSKSSYLSTCSFVLKKKVFSIALSVTCLSFFFTAFQHVGYFMVL
ncbi:hypothetical protein GGF37_002962 [Kickxella alabastrina]|nr:hypothetical protein GGF37_002962 [Kickxella alabastrina]